MKISIVSLIIGLLMINTLSGQVKIGNNPQNLNPASVLELESTTRALVITRVTDAQMNLINPLEGAVVYNTDQECLHYYNGNDWVNICEELDNSFTVSTRADYLSLLNPQARDSTVVISQTNNPDGSINYNYEVGQITGANIVTQSINADSKIQPTSITTGLLAPKSVTIGKFADATGGQPGDIFQWNGSQWTLVNETILGITEKDSIVGNEVFDATLNGSLVRSGAGTETDRYTLDVLDGGIDTDELADNAVTTLKMSDGNVTNAKLDKTNIPLSGFGAAGSDIDLGANQIVNLGVPVAATDAATKAYVDALDGTDDQDLGIGAGGTLNESVELTITDGTGTTIDIRDADSDITNELQNIEEVLTDGNDANGLVLTGLGVPVTATDAATKAYVDSEVGNINTLTDSNIYIGDATNTAQEVAISGDATMNNAGVLTIEPDAVTTAKIADANVTPGKIAPGTNGQVLTTTGGATSWENSLTSIVGATGQVALGSSISTGEYTINDGAITATSIIQLTVEENVSGNPIIIQLTNQIAGEFSVKIFEFQPAPTLTDANWQYIVINP
ncbi:MAG: hypothetical protein RIB79_10520 [Allomuricauda sp.]